MAESAFDGLTAWDVSCIRAAFLRGETSAEVRREWPGYSAKKIKQMRDEIFEPLKADPDAVKALANGPVLNANEIVRWKAPRSHRTPPEQIELFGSAAA